MSWAKPSHRTGTSALVARPRPKEGASISISRRTLIGAAAVGAGAVLLPETSDAQVGRPQRSLRIAHLPDVHVKPEGPSAQWFQRALQAAQEQKPDLIVMGGDQIFDGMARTKSETRAQWDLYRRILRDNTSVPVEHVMGNHDIWGWENPAVYKHEAGYGKAMALEAMSMQRPYRSFDRGGWHLVVLDSIHPKQVGYVAKLDDEQFEWLAADLKQNRGKNTLVITHAPILAACPFLFGPNEHSGNWRVSSMYLHIDARRLKDLFRENPQVKACISGHTHLAEHLAYLGVHYFCNGAVSGSWWKGPYQEFHPGYALIDLYPNGWVTRRLMSYGWKDG